MTVSTAAELLGKAYAGNTMMLGRYGIIIDDTLKKGEKFDAVLKLLNQRFGGSAQAELLTYAGQWAKLKNQWSDIQEFLGLVFLKTMQALQVSAGLVAIAFMSMGSKILQILNLLMTPLFKLLDAVGWVAEKLGATGIANIMEGITTSITNARQSILDSKDGVMAWTSANYESLKSFDGIENSLDKMGKTGSRTIYNTKKELTETEKAALKLREEWDQTARALQGDQRLAGLEGMRKDFETNLIAAEEMKEKFKDLPEKIRATAYALIDETKAQKDAGVITLSVQKSREDNAAAMEKEANELAHLTNAYYQLLESINPTLAVTNKYSKDMAVLNALLEQGKKPDSLGGISQSEYDKTKGMLDANATADLAGIQADYYSTITGYEETYREKQLAYIEAVRVAEIAAGKDKAAANAKAAEAEGKLAQELFEKKTRYISDGFGDLSTAFDGISKLYAEGSNDAKAWQEASNAMLVAQKAVAVVNAVATIANQGLGDPYTAFARIAAMAAAMGALLGSIGQSIGGSNVTASSSVYKPKSTVLGAEDGTGSESISNSFDMLEKIYSIEFTKLTGIYTEIKSLNTNIIGLVTSIARTGGVNDLANSINTNVQYPSSWGVVDNGLTGIKLIDTVYGWAQDAAVSIIDSFVGGTTTTSVDSFGIEIGKTLAGSILNGGSVAAKQYVSGVTTTTGGLFEGDDVYGYTNYAALDKSVVSMLTLVYKNLSSALVDLSEQFGTDTQKALNYVFESTKINLQGMTNDEMNKALQEYISNISDTAVEALFGNMLKGYQKLNEGLMETAVRLITDREVIAKYLEMTNQKFEGSIPAAIKFSEALVTIAGGLDKLTDSMQVYYEAFFSDSEQQAKLKSQLTDVMSMYGFDLPGTRSGYRALVESLNLASDAGQTAYVALMQMSKGADEYYSYLEQKKSSINPANYSTNLEYQKALAGLSSYADGGMSVGPDSGYLAQLHGTELVVSPRKPYPAKVEGLSNDDVVAAINELRKDVGQGNFYSKANSDKITSILNRWEGAGLPNTRT
ncbi:MAG: hypothetical protein WAW41_17680 [Methylobacter sp.]